MARSRWMGRRLQGLNFFGCAYPGRRFALPWAITFRPCRAGSKGHRGWMGRVQRGWIGNLRFKISKGGNLICGVLPKRRYVAGCGFGLDDSVQRGWLEAIRRRDATRRMLVALIPWAKAAWLPSGSRSATGGVEICIGRIIRAEKGISALWRQAVATPMSMIIRAGKVVSTLRQRVSFPSLRCRS